MAEKDAEAVGQFAELLERERKAILTGDFDGMAALIPQKEALVAVLSDQDAEAIGSLRQAAQRNQRLLASALSGVRGALGRLRQIDEGARGYTGYDRFGQAERIRRAPESVEKRA